jgi:hypothetical protein
MQNGMGGVGVVEQHLLDGVFGLVMGLAKLLAFSDGDGEIRGLVFVFYGLFNYAGLSMPKGLQVCIVR